MKTLKNVGLTTRASQPEDDQLSNPNTVRPCGVSERKKTARAVSLAVGVLKATASKIYVLEENFKNAARLLVDYAGNSLDTSTMDLPLSECDAYMVRLRKERIDFIVELHAMGVLRQELLMYVCGIRKATTLCSFF